LAKEGIKVCFAATPGPDTNLFSPPADKREHKASMGLNPDWFIVGSVMRNQPRKMFPEILWAFAQYIRRLEDDGELELAAKSYLHLHTSLSDVGWDIAAEIQKYHLSHKVLLTYIDDKTKKPYLGFYKGNPGWSMISPGNKCSFTPNTGGQLSREALADIVKCYDFYVQYSICEGLGIPVLEANACGVPATGLAYSATAEIVVEPYNTPLKVAAWRQELPKNETSQRRAMGKIDNLVDAIFDFARLPDSTKAERGRMARETTLKKYHSGVFIDGFKSVLESIDNGGYRAVWNDAPQIFEPNITQVPPFVTNEDFIVWAYANVLGRPYILTKETLDRHAKLLVDGRRTYMDRGLMKSSPFDRSHIIQELADVNQKINQMEVWRYHRVNNIPMPERAKYRCV
jgi:hypothetical protein